MVETTRYTHAELWLIDLANFASVKAFTDKVTNELDRVDILIENAAVATFAYSVTVDGWENSLSPHFRPFFYFLTKCSIQTNDLGLALLTILLLPKLFDTAKRFSILPRIVAVSSTAHYQVPFGDDLIEASNIHKKVSSEEYCTPA